MNKYMSIAMKTPLIFWALISLFPAAAGAIGNISPSDKYAWSEAAGWSNFNPSNGGVGVYDDHLEGLVWAENVGWIKLGSHNGGGYFTYANSSAGDWGVNLNGAVLSGYGWSETAGWIRFDPSNGGVTLNPANGVFDGWAWSENLGWIHFKGNSPAYNVLLAPSQQVNSLLVEAANPLNIRATVEGSGIHLSGDGGASWTPAATQPGDRRLKASVVSPLVPAMMYAASHGSGLFKSTDSGLNWTACANTGLNPNVYSLTIGGSGTLYAATKGGIFASADCAAWSAASTGLPSNAGLYSRTALAIDPAAPAILYAGIDGNGVYRSANSGNTWTAATIQPATTAVRALQIKPGNSATLFAATYGGGAFKSSDSGATWSACPTQPANLNLLSLAMDGGGKLYAGTEGGVFVSANDCGGWTAMNTGLPN